MVTTKLPTINDYQRIEKAIAYLEAHFREQPAVADVAANVGLSVSQFHRVFQRWAGITPRRFLEYVTAAHARRLLERSASVLESAWDSGLSGAGRLHDLFVSTEGVTPGEISQCGQGVVIRYGFHSSPFGTCLVAETERGVNRLVFIGDADLEAAVAGLHSDWPRARLVRDETGTATTMQRIVATLYDGETERPRLMVRGTNFQIRVWEALLRIPPGHVFSYQQVAERAGRPHAVRAVGSWFNLIYYRQRLRMLELRPNCECCDKDLPPESSEARICSFECTFCASCADSVLAGTCPNCGGELVACPRRPTSKLVDSPASKRLVFKPNGCQKSV